MDSSTAAPDFLLVDVFALETITAVSIPETKGWEARVSFQYSCLNISVLFAPFEVQVWGA